MNETRQNASMINERARSLLINLSGESVRMRHSGVLIIGARCFTTNTKLLSNLLYLILKKNELYEQQ